VAVVIVGVGRVIVMQTIARRKRSLAAFW
jgi:hypothetical protein